MVQIHKDKVGTVERPGLKTVRTTKVRFGSRRRNAPLQFAKPKSEQKVTGAIGRNIEDIMTARIKHEGGHLRILKAPDNVYEFAKGGARVSDKVLAQRANQIGWRKNKIQDREKELKMALNKEVRKEERNKIKKMVEIRDKEQKLALEKLQAKRAANVNYNPADELVNDDVAGNFFDDVIGQDFATQINAEMPVKPEEVGAKNSKGTVLTTKQLQRKEKIRKATQVVPDRSAKKPVSSANGPVRRANIKGLHDEKAMKLLDDGF
jgi:hypothetical protein